jgi:hypothetical protein
MGNFANPLKFYLHLKTQCLLKEGNCHSLFDTQGIILNIVMVLKNLNRFVS